MNKKVFFLILILALVLRFYKLGEAPLSLDWDEASNAYNAYSILKTARDEYGNFLPLVNKSFEDYKPPLYMYFNVPTVAILGLTPFAARLPSAFFGSLTVVAVYFLTKRLFEKNNSKELISLASMLLTAIMPWHLQFSRVGFEANIGLFFTVVAFTLFIYGFRSTKMLLTSAILFGLSFYSYHSARIFVPMLFLLTTFLFRDEIMKVSKKLLVLFGVFIIMIVLPFFVFTPKEAIFQRYETTTQKSRIENIDESIRFILQDRNSNIPFSNIIHNRRLVITNSFLANYFSHFDFNFLFTEGDNNFRHHVENMGLLYIFQLPFFIYGIYLLIKAKMKEAIFILGWFLFAPIPASFGDAVPHAVRSLTMVVPIQVITAYALANLYKTVRFKKVFIALSSIILGISLLPYLHNYYYHYVFDKASWWQYGYQEAVLESEKLKNQFEKINVDNSLEQAYIFWLFNTKYDPFLYQQLGTRSHFDKYYFEKNKTENPKELYVSTNLPESYQILKTIYLPDGKEAIKIGYPR